MALIANNGPNCIVTHLAKQHESKKGNFHTRCSTNKRWPRPIKRISFPPPPGGYHNQTKPFNNNAFPLHQLIPIWEDMNYNWTKTNKPGYGINQFDSKADFLPNELSLAIA